MELEEGMTAKEAQVAREERLSGSSPTEADVEPLLSEITEGMTAEEAEAARSTRA